MWPGSQYMDPSGMSWMGWMVGGSIVFWVAIIALAVFAITRLAPRREHGGDALAVLDQRLARGEIDADEYRSRRGLLLEH